MSKEKSSSELGHEAFVKLYERIKEKIPFRPGFPDCTGGTEYYRNAAKKKAKSHTDKPLAFFDMRTNRRWIILPINGVDIILSERYPSEVDPEADPDADDTYAVYINISFMYSEIEEQTIDVLARLSGIDIHS